MGNGSKIVFVLPLLLMFLGYCGDGQEKSSAGWLTTSETISGLNVPAALHAQCLSSGHIKITWNAFTTTATDLVIERKSPTEDYQKVGDIDVAAGTFTDNVVNGIVYTYRVRAVVMQGSQIQYVSTSYSVEANASAANLCPVIVDPGVEDQIPLSPEPV